MSNYKQVKKPKQRNQYSPGARYFVFFIGSAVTNCKTWYQNCCWEASGKCERCRAPECRDRNWRKRKVIPTGM